MKATTFDRWDAGIDLRKSGLVSDANRLRDLVNCDVTNGLAIRKRPGLRLVRRLPDSSAGLFVVGQAINVVTQDSLGVTGAPEVLHKAIVVAGFLYVSVKVAGVTRHYWFDSADTKVIADALCPHSEQVVALAGKVFAASPDGSTVRFCATNNPRDWSKADDAGFLPISHNGGGRVTALAVYRGYLAVFTDVHVQIWKVDPDPAQHALIDIAHGISSEHPFSITSVSGDVLFLGMAGVRSLSQQSATGNLADVDIGSPVDALAALLLGRNYGVTVAGHYSQALGKFLLFFGREVLVYSFSKTSKVAAWSRWVMPGSVEAAVDLMGKTYLRIGGHLYFLDADAFDDAGVVFPVTVDMVFLALKAPGALKRLAGVDAVVEGECDLFVGCDEVNPMDEVLVANLAGDSRPGGTLAVELHGTAFSPRFKCAHSLPFQLDLLTLYYDVAGVR